MIHNKVQRTLGRVVHTWQPISSLGFKVLVCIQAYNVMLFHLMSVTKVCRNCWCLRLWGGTNAMQVREVSFKAASMLLVSRHLTVPSTSNVINLKCVNWSWPSTPRPLPQPSQKHKSQLVNPLDTGSQSRSGFSNKWTFSLGFGPIITHEPRSDWSTP